MKRLVTITLVSSCLLTTAIAGTSPHISHSQRTPTKHQQPLAMPDSSTSASNSASNPPTKLIITDVLGRDTSISIFAGLIRDVESVSNRLQDRSVNTTVLAPRNAELMKMPRKPWEDPEDYSAFGADAYEGAQGESRAQMNLRRFVEAHLVAASPFVAGKPVKTLAGNEVSLEEGDGGERVVRPDGVGVVGVVDRVSNGEVWVVGGVLTRPKS